ncbi:MAG: hypothetical protein IJ252_14400 [Solobacterium sp.]|nr:hypothetical protein [Solobacterium sp.]
MKKKNNMFKKPVGKIDVKKALEHLHRQEEETDTEAEEVKKKFRPDRNVAVLLYGPPPVLRKKK